MPEKKNMGLHPLLAKGGGKRKNRWMFNISPYIGDSVNALPPNKAARPSVSFKEMSAEHLHETIYFPGKVEWNTVDVSLYDVKCEDNLIFNWMKKIYDPTPGSQFYGPALLPSAKGTGSQNFKLTATLTLYSGCGDVMETWIYMNAFPNKIDWTDLDMSSSEVTTVDLTLRYDRAYIVRADEEGKLPPNKIIES